MFYQTFLLNLVKGNNIFNMKYFIKLKCVMFLLNVYIKTLTEQNNLNMYDILLSKPQL